jgi:hypothetical protein
VTAQPPLSRTGEQILRFDDEVSIGSLAVRRVGAEREAKWQFLGAAQWPRLIPAGMEVSLRVDPSAPAGSLRVLRRLPRDAFAQVILPDCPVDDEIAPGLAHSTRLRLVDLFRTDVGDYTASAMATVPTLEWLSFTGTAVGDDGVSDLASLSALRRLSLKWTAVTDSSAELLASLPSLEWLSLSGTLVTNDGLALLTAAPSLRQLSVTGSLVDADGVASWWSRRPDVQLVVH